MKSPQKLDALCYKEAENEGEEEDEEEEEDAETESLQWDNSESESQIKPQNRNEQRNVILFSKENKEISQSFSDRLVIVKVILTISLLSLSHPSENSQPLHLRTLSLS